MDTAEQQKEHPGVVAMRAHVETLSKNVDYFRRSVSSAEEERAIAAKIAELRDELAAMQVRRHNAEEKLHAKEEELRLARETLERCKSDPLIAQAMWLGLLLSRQPKRR